MSGEFDGLVAVVTGGASGIGLATSLALTERGARVAVLDLKPEGLDARLTGFVADVGDRASVDAAITAVGEGLCRRQADARGAARHEGDEAVELRGAHACTSVCRALPRPSISSSTTSPARR